MMATADRVDTFLSEFVRWVSGCSDIVAVGLVGSYARGEATADSDVDLVIVTPRAETFLRGREWVHRFGTVTQEHVESYGQLTSLRVHYESGLEVEYGLTGEQWLAVPLDKGTREVMEGGMKVLFERESWLSRHEVS